MEKPGASGSLLGGNQQQGINVDKMVGLLKPKFFSIYDDSTEDFGVVAVDHFLQ